MPGARIEKLSIDDNQTLTVTLKSNSLNCFVEPQNDLWTFDLEGRPIGFFIDSVNYRRTLNNTFHKKSRKTIDGEDYRDVEMFSPEKSKYLLEKGVYFLQKYAHQLPNDFHPIIKNIIDFSFTKLSENGELFSDIYLPISILPPDQYMSIVVQITEGCNYNKCTFCNFYRDRPFRIKSQTEIDTHLENIKSFLGEGIKLRKSIFLADANAIVMPQNKLVSAMESIQKSFPEIPHFYSFVDVFTGIKKTEEDYQQLANLGLKRVYLGIESGSIELLQLLNKPTLSEDIIQLSNTLKKSGVQLGLIFLAGAGGKAYHKQHVEDSVELLSHIELGKGDIVYISEFIETNPEYNITLSQYNVEPPSRVDIRLMANDLKQTIKKISSKETKVAVYDIQQFFY